MIAVGTRYRANLTGWNLEISGYNANTDTYTLHNLSVGYSITYGGIALLDTINRGILTEIPHPSNPGDTESFGSIVKKLSGTECECGKDKHGFASHCNWCPKAKENSK